MNGHSYNSMVQSWYLAFLASLRRSYMPPSVRLAGSLVEQSLMIFEEKASKCLPPLPTMRTTSKTLFVPAPLRQSQLSCTVSQFAAERPLRIFATQWLQLQELETFFRIGHRPIQLHNKVVMTLMRHGKGAAAAKTQSRWPINGQWCKTCGMSDLELQSEL